MFCQAGTLPLSSARSSFGTEGGPRRIGRDLGSRSRSGAALSRRRRKVAPQWVDFVVLLVAGSSPRLFWEMGKRGSHLGAEPCVSDAALKASLNSFSQSPRVAFNLGLASPPLHSESGFLKKASGLLWWCVAVCFRFGSVCAEIADDRERNRCNAQALHALHRGCRRPPPFRTPQPRRLEVTGAAGHFQFPSLGKGRSLPQPRSPAMLAVPLVSALGHE